MLGNMGEAPAPVRTTGGTSVKRAWRYTRWGSVILSPDFYIGVPAGIAIGLLPALNKAAGGMATVLLIALGAALVAIAAVVVAAVTIFVTLLSPEYEQVLDRLPGGVKGAAKPFVTVAWVSVVGTLCSFAAALAWPAIPQHLWWLLWLTFSIPAALTAQALLGSAQLVSMGSFHVRQRAALMKAVREVRQRNRPSRSA
jgi:hypothetical protein